MGHTDLQRTVGALQIIGGIASLYYGGGAGAGGGGLIGSGIQNVSGSKSGSFNRGGAGFLQDLGTYLGGNALGGAASGQGAGAGLGLGNLLGGSGSFGGGGGGGSPLGGILGGLFGGGGPQAGAGGGGTDSLAALGVMPQGGSLDALGLSGTGMESGGFGGGQATGGGGFSQLLASPVGQQLAMNLLGGKQGGVSTPQGPLPPQFQAASMPQADPNAAQQATQPQGMAPPTQAQPTQSLPAPQSMQTQLPSTRISQSPDISKLLSLLQGTQGVSNAFA